MTSCTDKCSCFITDLLFGQESRKSTIPNRKSPISKPKNADFRVKNRRFLAENRRFSIAFLRGKLICVARTQEISFKYYKLKRELSWMIPWKTFSKYPDVRSYDARLCKQPVDYKQRISSVTTTWTVRKNINQQ